MTESVTLPELREELDAALALLPDITDPALRVDEVERSLGRGLQRVYRALASPGDHVVFREQTQAAVGDVREALVRLMDEPSEDAEALAASAAIARCLGRLQQLRWTLVEGVDLPARHGTDAPLRATRDAPTLLRVDRDVLRPGLPLDEPPIPAIEPPATEVLPAPATHAEVQEKAAALAERLARMVSPSADGSEPAPAPAEPNALPSLEEASEAHFGRVLSVEELLEERARDCLDELAMLGRMRRCTEVEGWDSGDETERRLLTRVDAIVACGVEACSNLVRTLDDRPLPDPELTYANLFFLLCLAGDDAFDQARRVLLSVDLEDDEMRLMCTDAFVFGPHPRIAPFARGWLSEAAPERRELAVDVLRRRRALGREELNACANDAHVPVLVSLARALPELAGGAPPGALGWLSRHEDPRVVAAALESALRMRDATGYARALELVAEGRGAFGDAIVVAAIAGDESTRAPLEYELATACTPSALRAAGWFGESSLVPFLLGRLEHGDDAEKAASLEALQRITGASIVDASIEPEYAPEDAPFRRGRCSYEDPGILDATPAAWRGWWERWGSAAEPGVRYRWGHRYSLVDTLEELTQTDRPYRTRHLAAMELAVRGGQVVGLHRDDFIARQRRDLEALVKRVGDPRGVVGWARSLSGR